MSDDKDVCDGCYWNRQKEQNKGIDYEICPYCYRNAGTQRDMYVSKLLVDHRIYWLANYRRRDLKR